MLVNALLFIPYLFNICIFSFRFSFCKSAVPFVAFCHDQCHHHHNPKLKYHQLYKIHWAALWIFCLSFSQTCLLLGAIANGNIVYLSIPNWHVKWLSIMICNEALNYGTMNLQLLVLGILHVLILAVYYWQLGPYELAYLLLGLVLLGPGIVILFPLLGEHINSIGWPFGWLVNS